MSYLTVKYKLKLVYLARLDGDFITSRKIENELIEVLYGEAVDG